MADWRELLRNPFTEELEPGRQTIAPATPKRGLDWLLDYLTYPGEKTELYNLYQKRGEVQGMNPPSAFINRFDSGLVTKSPFSGGEYVLDPGDTQVMSDKPNPFDLTSSQLSYITSLLGIE